MPTSPFADLLDSWAAQADASRQQRAAAGIIQQYGGLPTPPSGQPAAPSQGGILSQLLGFGGQASPRGGGLFDTLFGGQQQPGAPLDLTPSSLSAPAGASSPAGAASTPSPFSSGLGPITAPRTPVPAFAPAPAGPLPTFAAAGGAPGQDNTSRALAFYQSKGLSPLAASALVGGFHAESGKGLNTTAVNRGDGSDGSNSVGIAQWNGDRARGLQSFAAANGLDLSNIDTQLQYSWLELNGPERATLQALQNPNLNPGTATAAALGYERPAGWTAANPYAARTFGSRLANTARLASGGFSAPFDDSPIGPNPNSFTPDQQGAALPSFAASGLGMRLPAATPLQRLVEQSQPGRSVGTAYSASGQAVSTDADGNALGADGRPTALSYTGASPAAAAPASRAIAAASPAGDPLVNVPGYQGQWNKARIAAAPDGTDVPDDGELARAQAGGETVQVPQRATQVGLPSLPSAPVPSVPPAAAAAMSSRGSFQISPQLIQAMLQNDDTRGFGIELWKSLATSRKAPIVQDGYVIDGNTGQPMYALPQRAQLTEAEKDFEYGQRNPAFRTYQDDKKAAERGQMIDVPLPNGQFQKTWITPGQAPSRGVAVGAPYVPRPTNSVTIDQKAESAQEQEFGKAQGQEIGETIKAGATAPQALNTIRMMRAAAAAGGDNLSTGPLGQISLKAKQVIGNALNIDIPGTSEAEVLNNLGYGLATQAARAISNRPTQFEFGQALAVKPGIAQSKAGFQALLNIRQQDLEDQLALGKLASVKANRDNWLAVKAQYYADHPVMSPFDPSKPLGAGDVQAINGSQQQAASAISTQDASALPVISSPAAAARLKPGTQFRTPDGRVMQR